MSKLILLKIKSQCYKEIAEYLTKEGLIYSISKGLFGMFLHFSSQSIYSRTAAIIAWSSFVTCSQLFRGHIVDLVVDSIITNKFVRVIIFSQSF